MMISSVRTRCWLAECLGELGEFAEGIACAAEAVRIAETAAHLSSVIFALSRLGRLALRQGDLQHAISILERALAQFRATDIRLFLSWVIADLGLAYALSGRVAEALPLLDQVVVEDLEDNGPAGSPLIISLGEAYLLAGRPENASHLEEHALMLSRDRKEHGYQAWSLWLLGEIALHGHPPAFTLAETHYRQALTLADELGMRPLMAHCHAGLGTLYTQTGQREQARTELSAAIALYRAMAMTFWLLRTAATLAQVLGMLPEDAQPTGGRIHHLVR